MWRDRGELCNYSALWSDLGFGCPSSSASAGGVATSAASPSKRTRNRSERQDELGQPLSSQSPTFGSHTKAFKSSTGRLTFLVSLFQFQETMSLKSDWELQRRGGQAKWCWEVCPASSVPCHSLPEVRNPTGTKVCSTQLKSGLYLKGESFWAKARTYRQRKKLSVDLYTKTIRVIVLLRATCLWQAKSAKQSWNLK